MCNGKRKIYKLLEILPTRGPDCFAKFLHVLDDCNHEHVAEYIRDMEKGTIFAEVYLNNKLAHLLLKKIK